MPFTLADAAVLLAELDRYEKAKGGAIHVGPWQLVIAFYLNQTTTQDNVATAACGFIRKAQFAIAQYDALVSFYARRGYDPAGVPSVASLTADIRRREVVRAESSLRSDTSRANSEMIATYDSMTTGSPRYIRAPERRALHAYLTDMLAQRPAGDNVVHEVNPAANEDNDRRGGSPDPDRPVLSTEDILNEFCTANIDCFTAFVPAPAAN
jgi:hypothetical protein